ncbi:peptidylprolyl isomerase [Robertkochia flava]|uniref:peptidylprolyl isomerase n=1 Tax=Robertkochia flava TaxID=3447986 RepID=UPI001CCFD57B|nr:peptidylprolyl isomerase [Robertkochia marina]
MKKISLLFILGLIVTACSSSKVSDLDDGLYADIQTSKGAMLVELYYQQTPLTVANFVSLAEGTNTYVNEEFKGKPFYEGTIFHRVIKDFMIQGGDPTGTGSGGPGYKFNDEIVDSLTHDGKGVLSMANAGPGTNGSQFFITHDTTAWLNGKHTVFGKVVKGLEVIDSIATTEVSTDPSKANRPAEDIVIEKVEIYRKGKEAKNFDAPQVMTTYFKQAEERAAAARKMIEDAAAEFASQKQQADSTASGLKYIYLKETDGEKPAMGSTVMVNYAGYFEDGNLFDSNIQEVAAKYGKIDVQRRDMGGYRPFPMEIDPEARLIPGFKEGLTLLKYGEKIRIFIPSHLGYGQAGFPPVIPPNTNLVFDLEIVEE